MHENLRKKCSYCGRLYPVEAEVCSLDGHSLNEPRPKQEPPPLPASDERIKLVLGFVGGVAGFFILFWGIGNDKPARPKLFLLTALSLAGGILCLIKLFEPWASQFIETPVQPGKSNAPIDSSTSGPLRCTYCGKHHPEGTEVCDLDGQPLRRV